VPFAAAAMLIEFLGAAKLSTPSTGLPLLAGQPGLFRPENANRHAAHCEVGWDPAVRFGARRLALRANPAVVRARGMAAERARRAEETRCRWKKIAKRTQSRRRNPGGSRDWMAKEPSQFVGRLDPQYPRPLADVRPLSCSLLRRRRHGFPRSHRPPERKVKAQWSMLRYRTNSTANQPEKARKYNALAH
jgi:hypothetical protein